MPLAIEVLKADLKSFCPDVKVIGIADGVITGAKILKEKEPDILFLDIRMKDGTGFDLLEIDPDLLAAAIKKVVSGKEGQQAQLKILQENLTSSRKPDKIVLHTLERIAIIAVKDIIRCEANGNYTYFHIASQKKILVTRTLKDFEKLLESHSFIRVHQSHLVNSDHIKAYEKTEGGYLKMSDGSNVPVSVRKKAYVVRYLEGI